MARIPPDQPQRSETASKGLGVRVAIDDFGTGYSSLSYLRQLPVDILKVDKSFIDGVQESPEASAVARAIIRLGHTLSLQTVAEGIEESTQLDALHTMQCDLGQGYLFAKPLSSAELEEHLSATQTTEHSDTTRRPSAQESATPGGQPADPTSKPPGIPGRFTDPRHLHIRPSLSQAITPVLS